MNGIQFIYFFLVNYPLHTCGLTHLNIVYMWFEKCHFTDLRLALLHRRHYPLQYFSIKKDGKFIFYLFFSSFLSLSFSPSLITATP